MPTVRSRNYNAYHRYRDDWALRHFLHPKLLRKAREVRTQLEDIMKFQKMDIISGGTDYDILRFAYTPCLRHVLIDG